MWIYWNGLFTVFTSFAIIIICTETIESTTWKCSTWSTIFTWTYDSTSIFRCTCGSSCLTRKYWFFCCSINVFWCCWFNKWTNCSTLWCFCCCGVCFCFCFPETFYSFDETYNSKVLCKISYKFAHYPHLQLKCSIDQEKTLVLMHINILQQGESIRSDYCTFCLFCLEVWGKKALEIYIADLGSHVLTGSWGRLIEIRLILFSLNA